MNCKSRAELDPLVDKLLQIMKEFGVSMHCVEYVVEQLIDKAKCSDIK